MLTVENKTGPENNLPISPSNMLQFIQHPRLQELLASGEHTVTTSQDQTAVQIEITRHRDDFRWFLYKLRDRKNDGPGWEPTPLTDWPYTHYVDMLPDGWQALEESTYWLDPAQPLTDVFPSHLAEFITNPFESLPFANPTISALQTWAEQWHSIVQHRDLGVYPGYFALRHIPGVRRHIFESVKTFLAKTEYTHLTAVPTWYHISQIYQHLGFTHTHHKDAQEIKKLSKKVQEKTTNPVLGSWIIMLQFWAELAVAAGLKPEVWVNPNYLLKNEAEQIMTYPLNPERNLWLHYPLK